jgi:hypothetical protein
MPMPAREAFHRCRRCRCKLPEITETRANAFCARSCAVHFFRRHCIVCERETEVQPPPNAGRPVRNFCSRSCKNAFQRNPFIYGHFLAAKPPSRPPTETQKSGCAAAVRKRQISRPSPLNVLAGQKLPNALELDADLLAHIRRVESRLLVEPSVMPSPTVAPVIVEAEGDGLDLPDFLKRPAAPAAPMKRPRPRLKFRMSEAL